MENIKFKRMTLEKFNKKYDLDVNYDELKEMNNVDDELKDIEEFNFFSSLNKLEVIEYYKKELDGLFWIVDFIEENGVYLLLY